MTDQNSDLASVSVRRPLLAIVLNLLIVIAGLAAWRGLEVRELPNIDLARINVTADYPGASPGTVDAEVTSILEGAIARVPNIREINAESEEANTRIEIQFNPGTDIAVAASDVREAVSQVQADLPSRIERLSVVKEDSNATPIMQIAILADEFDIMSLSTRVSNDIAPLFSSINGVATVVESGIRKRQLQVAIDPLQLSRYHLTISEVSNALRDAPYDIPVGSYLSESQELLVRAEAPAITADLVEQIEIRDGIQVGDVAQAYFAPSRVNQFVRLNGEPAIGLGIVRQANSNSVEISKRVRAKVEELSLLHKDLTFVITSDQAVFINASTTEVLRSLLLTCGVVVLSILMFFGRFRATLIPGLAIPTALIGSLVGFWLLGYSINLITLLALILATGLTVDDAIVVVENIQRRRSQGETPSAAAILGTRQVFFAVISTTAVLAAVFIPMSLLPSTVGQLFREFGVILALAVVISSVVALTLVPALASRIDSERKSGGFEIFPTIGKGIQSLYMKAIYWIIRFPVVMLSLAVATGYWAYSMAPNLVGELIPEEDRGVIQIVASGPDGVGVEYMSGQADQIEKLFLPLISQGLVESIYTLVGDQEPNRIVLSVALAPWEERQQSHTEIIEKMEPALDQVPGSQVNIFGPSAFDFEDTGSGSGLAVALTGPSYPRIHEVALNLQAHLEDDSSMFDDVEISYNPTQPQMTLEIDRQSASDLGVSLSDLGDTLSVLVGGLDLTELNIADQAVPIILKAPTGLFDDPALLREVMITSTTGQLVPVSSVTTISQTGVAAAIERAAQRRAIIIEADTDNTAISAVIEEFKRIATKHLPEDIGYVFRGGATTYEETTSSVSLTYGFAILIVFLVLIAQFNNLWSPIVVIAVFPFGLATTILAMLATGVTINLYSQIGAVLLIGLMAKNSILLVEFADQQRKEGLSASDAIQSAAQTRLRPIAMTLLSTMVGALPLLLSSGPGGEARSAIGWTIFAGLGFSGLLTLFLTPAIYVLIASVTPRVSAKR